MANKENNADIQSMPSFLSSSGLLDDVSLRNELSFKFNNDDDMINVAFGSLSEIKGDEGQKSRPRAPLLELRRCTSFEEMLMENHRTVLIHSIREYFQRTKHSFLQTVKNLKDTENPSTGDDTTTAEEAELLVEAILAPRFDNGEVIRQRIMARLRENTDELSIVAEVLKICPSKIQCEVLVLITAILEDCDEIIQHFKRRNLPRELKERSTKLAGSLAKMPALSYLFNEVEEELVAPAFEVLVEKWAITVFLMKVGVFENELESKSIEECLKSEVFGRIDLNDLLNQHLIHPRRLRRS